MVEHAASRLTADFLSVRAYKSARALEQSKSGDCVGGELVSGSICI